MANGNPVITGTIAAVDPTKRVVLLRRPSARTNRTTPGVPLRHSTRSPAVFAVSRGVTRRLGWLFAVCLVGVTSAAFGGPTRHAGRVEQIDLTAGFLVVDQLARHGKHERQLIRIADDTSVVTASRPRSWDRFEEHELTQLEVLVGDFVVVESAEHGGHLLARRITVVQTGRRPVQDRSRP